MGDPGYLIDKNFLSSAVRTTSGRSSWVNISEKDQMIVFVDVTAASGTSPTLDIVIEGSPIQTIGDADAWTLETFTQITTTGRAFKSITPYCKYVRIKYTVGGTTPSFTFSIVGQLK